MAPTERGTASAATPEPLDRHVVMGSGGTALAVSGIVALVGAAPDSDTTRACETALFGGATIDELARLLSAAPGDRPVSFAIVQSVGSAVGSARSVVVAGTSAATIGSSEALRHDGGTDPAWSSAAVDGHARITLTLGGDDAPTGQWFTSGVVAAGAVSVGRLAPSARAAVAAARPSTLAPGGGAAVDFGNLVGRTEDEPPTTLIEAIEAAAPSAPPPDAARAAHTAPFRPAPSETVSTGHGRLVFDDGRDVALDRPIVVGRRPPDRPIDDLPPHRIEIDDKLLSRHHATLRLVDGRLVVTDEGSTNGTTVAVPGLPPARCMPNQAVEVPVGATVEFAGLLTATHQPGTTQPSTNQPETTPC